VTDASFEGAPGSAATAGSVTNTANLSLFQFLCVCGDMASSIMHVIFIHVACARCTINKGTVHVLMRQCACPSPQDGAACD
jgi:hypothetical protein